MGLRFSAVRRRVDQGAGAGAVVEEHVDDHLQKDDVLHVLEPYFVSPLQIESYTAGLPSATQHEPPLVGLWAGVGAVVEEHVDDHLQNDDALHVLEP